MAFIDAFFFFCARNREKIITIFKSLYLLIFLFTVIGSFSLYQGNVYKGFFLNLAVRASQTAIILYILTIIPGIFRRFGKQHKLVALLMIYRRYIGIAVFFTILYHYMMERGVFLIQSGVQNILSAFSHYMLFEIMGTVAFFFIFLLAVTSNDISTSKLGIWWGRIHNLTYVIVWFMFLHVALQRVTIWTLLLGMAGGIQVLSFIYKRFKK